MASALLIAGLAEFTVTGLTVTLKPAYIASISGTFTLTGNGISLSAPDDLYLDTTATLVTFDCQTKFNTAGRTSTELIATMEYFPIDISASRVIIYPGVIEKLSFGEFLVDTRSSNAVSGGEDFPSLYPSSRQWAPGEVAQNAFNSIGGKETRIILGSRRRNDVLTLTFENLEDADANLIIDHYSGQRGSFNPFGLASETLGGILTQPNTSITEPSNLWRYNRPPSVTYTQPNVQTVSVELLQVIP